MKSSYELAMERLEKSAPSKKLTEAQRAQIQEIETIYKAKIAERETYAESKIAIAKSTGDLKQAGTTQAELAVVVKRLEEECEEKKARARSS